MLNGAAGQLRNMATVGGNLLQSTRCLYFQDVTKPCNKRKPGSGCPARQGRSPQPRHPRQLRVVPRHPPLGHGRCARRARRRRARGGPQPARAPFPISGLYRLPGQEPDRDTTLEHGSLITAVEVPPLGFGRRSAYRKVRDRASFAFAVTSVAAAIDVADGVVRDVRLALGAVAPVPWRAVRAEQAMRGQPATAATFRRAADAELADARPLPDNAFKLNLVRNVVIRTLSDLVGVSS